MLYDLPLTLLYLLSFPEGAKFHSVSRTFALTVSTAAFFFFFFFFWLHCETCVILVPWLGIKPPLLAIEAWSLNHWTAREVPSSASFYKLSPYHHSVLRLNVSSSGRSWRAPKCKEGSHSLSMKGENVSHSVVSNSLQPHGLQPTRLLHPWDFSRQEYWSGVPLPSPFTIEDTW